MVVVVLGVVRVVLAVVVVVAVALVVVVVVVVLVVMLVVILVAAFVVVGVLQKFSRRGSLFARGFCLESFRKEVWALKQNSWALELNGESPDRRSEV